MALCRLWNERMWDEEEDVCRSARSTIERTIERWREVVVCGMADPIPIRIEMPPASFGPVYMQAPAFHSAVCDRVHSVGEPRSTYLWWEGASACVRTSERSCLGWLEVEVQDSWRARTCLAVAGAGLDLLGACFLRASDVRLAGPVDRWDRIRVGTWGRRQMVRWRKCHGVGVHVTQHGRPSKRARSSE